MIKWIGFHVIFLAATFGFIRCSDSYRRVCYFTNWAQYRPTPYKFTPENVDPFLCTHIIFAFAEVSGNDITPYEWNDESTDWSKGNYEKAADLKKSNPKLKILLALGGWNYGVGEFSALVHNSTEVEKFAVHAVQFLRRINFDGLDIDWEYPGNRGSPSEDKHLYTRFCKILRKAFEIETKLKGHSRLLLTAAVAAGETVVKSAYEIAQVSKSLDFINLMTYDLHGSFESFLGENSPLYGRHGESTEQKKLNQDYAVHLWIDGGAPRHKLNLGMALYGRAFRMTNNKDNVPGKPASGAGTSGRYTREQGFLSYYEICKNLNNGWKRVWNDEQKVPYTYHGDQWVGYDDLESFEIKANYVKKNRLGGTMVWAMDLDDIHGVCGYGKNPLQNKIKEVLTGVKVKQLHQSHINHHVQHADSSEHKDVHKSTHTSDELYSHAVSAVEEHLKSLHEYAPKQIPKKPVICGVPFHCEDGHYYAEMCDNQVYYLCWKGKAHKQKCPTRTVWNESILACDIGEHRIVHGIMRHRKQVKHSDEFQPHAVTTSEKHLKPSHKYVPKPIIPKKQVICGAPFHCEDGHYYAENCDNQVYYLCWKGKANKQKCPTRTVWNESILACDLGEHQIVHGIMPHRKQVTHTSKLMKIKHGGHHDHTLTTEGTTKPLFIEHGHKIPAHADLTHLHLHEHSIKSSNGHSEISGLYASSKHLGSAKKIKSQHIAKNSNVHCGPPTHCIYDGEFYGDGCNDEIYYICVGGKALKKKCPPNTVWNEPILTCDTLKHKMSYDLESEESVQKSYNLLHNKAAHLHTIPDTKHATVTSSEHGIKTVSTGHSAQTLIRHAIKTPSNKHALRKHLKPCGGPKHCKGGRYYVDKCDDTVYYLCWGGKSILKTCPQGTHWDSSITACDWIKR